MTNPTIHQENLRWLLEQSADVKISLLESHLDICRPLVNQVLEEEVAALRGARYSHDKPHDGRDSRWGYNPGSVRSSWMKSTSCAALCSASRCATLPTSTAIPTPAP